MDTVEGTLVIYGKPIQNTIVEKNAAVNAAQKAKEQGKIIDYRIEEETETTGKIIATMEMPKSEAPIEWRIKDVESL